MARPSSVGGGRALCLAVLGILSIGSAACRADVFDVDVALSPHAYQADFGPSTGTIPTLACDPAMPSACGARAMLAVMTAAPTPVPATTDVSVELGCDPSTSRCFAEAHARVIYELDVLQDVAFVTKVERHAVSVVQSVDLAYTLPTNTLTFDVPRVDVYVGPAGTTKETDAGAVLVDSISSIAAGTTFVADQRHLMLAEGSNARALIVSSIQAKQPFVFVVVTAPRAEAGSPVPGGAFEIDIYPTVSLGLE